MFGWSGCLNLLKRFAVRSSSNCLIKKSNHDWLVEIIVNQCQDLGEKFRSPFIRTIRVRLPNCRTFVLTTGFIQIFSNLLYFPQIDIQNYSYWILFMNVKQYSMPIPNFQTSDLYHGVVFLTDSVHLILIWCTVDKTWNKQSAWAKLII